MLGRAFLLKFCIKSSSFSVEESSSHGSPEVSKITIYSRLLYFLSFRPHHIVSLKAGVPNPGATDLYICGLLATGPQSRRGVVSKQSFICIYSRSPSLALPPELRNTSSGLPLILYYGELYNYFIPDHNVTIIEIKCTINVMLLNHPQTIPLAPPPSTELSSVKPVPCANRLLWTAVLSTNLRKSLVLSFSRERVLLRMLRTPTTKDKRAVSEAFKRFE